jgi:hypothetical protein
MGDLSYGMPGSFREPLDYEIPALSPFCSLFSNQQFNGDGVVARTSLQAE